MKVLLISITLLVFINLSFSSIYAAGLPSEVQQLLKRYKVQNDDVSIHVRDLNNNETLISHNINDLKNPASTMKLFTTYAALKTLKPNYVWKTEAWMRGTIKEGVLDGDLILKGYGDPFLIHEKYWKFVQGIKDRGLQKIKGDIIIDNSFFDIPYQDPGSFDNKPLRTYNAMPSALMYNFQATRLLFRPNPEKKKIDVIPYPWIPEYNYSNRLKYTDKRCRRRHHRPIVKRHKQKVSISGSYSAKCGQQYVLRVISKPDEHAYQAFRDFWQGSTTKISGGMKIGKVQSGDKKYHTYYSDSLGNQIRVINKWSNNVMTRQLLLSIGAKKYGKPGTLEKGRRGIIDVLEQNGIDSSGMIIDNGSGLSRSSRVSAKQLAELLVKAWRDPFMPEFMSSLALSGLDGTMVKRFRTEAQKGRLHMKTGTLRNVKAIAGYLLTRQGKWLSVVVLHNGSKVGAGRGAKIQDAVLRWSFEQ